MSSSLSTQSESQHDADNIKILFEQKDYKSTIESAETFLKTYPKSKYRDDVTILLNKSNEKLHPIKMAKSKPTPQPEPTVNVVSQPVVKTKPSQKASGNGHELIRGKRGGCYYYSDSGEKVYVDRSLCN